MKLVQSIALCGLAGVACGQSTINVQWDSTIRPLKTVPGFQTVVNPLTTRESPVHDAVYASIASLGASYQRYVPWLPYPRLGIAELEAPSTGALCGFVNSGGSNGLWSTTLDCGSRGLGTISKVDFASYGTPTGTCGSLSAGTCNAPTSASVVQTACIGKSSCTITSNDATFGAVPCGSSATFAVQVQCSGGTPSTVYTYWDFTYPDQGMVDFLEAAASSKRPTIPNFSTIPSHLFQRSARQTYPDDPLGEMWDYESGGNTFIDPSLEQLGDYYGRLVAHYVEGGFNDEAGVFIPGYNYTISHWEVLNEIESEHSMDPPTYTAVYDAIVTGIRKHAPTGSASMQFMGLALKGSGNTQYVSYFLNASNHAPGIPLDWISFHHYAGSARDGGGPQANYSGYTSFFSSGDQWLGVLADIVSIRDALNPTVRLDADEVGVILDDDNDPKWTSAVPGFDPIYWNAAAASYVYLYGGSSVLGLDVLGESQLVGYPSFNFTRGAPYNGLWTAPPQYPSVALLNWTDGTGTARYWALKLLVDGMNPGAPAGPYSAAQADVIVNTTISAPNSTLPGGAFCGSILNLDTLSLYCTQPGATINAVQFASYGTPTGACGSWGVGTCNAANSTTIVESYCLGKNTCSVPATTDIFGDPCYGTVKYLDVQATCTTGSGGQTGGGSIATVYAQAYVEAAGSGVRKVLVVNKVGYPQVVTLPGATGGTWTYVDLTTAFGPPATMTLPADSWTMQAFGVGILRLTA